MSACKQNAHCVTLVGLHLSQKISNTKTHPEFDEEEGLGGTFVVHLFQATLLLRKLVVDLPNVDTLQKRKKYLSGRANIEKEERVVQFL